MGSPIPGHTSAPSVTCHVLHNLDAVYHLVGVTAAVPLISTALTPDAACATTAWVCSYWLSPKLDCNYTYYKPSDTGTSVYKVTTSTAATVSSPSSSNTPSALPANTNTAPVGDTATRATPSTRPEKVGNKKEPPNGKERAK